MIKALATQYSLLIKQRIPRIKRVQVMLSKQFKRVVEHTIDPVIALFMLLLLSPLFMLRAAAAYARCGQVFEKRNVTGVKGSSFSLLSFSCDYPGKSLACLINIIKGELAFVGPDINKQINDVRLSVKPGIVSTYKIRKKVCIAHEDELTADLEYVYRKSVVGDLAIVVRNVMSSLLGGSKTLPEPYMVDFFGIKLWNTSMQDAVKWILMNTHNKDKKQLAFVNPDCLNISFKHAEYKRILQSVDHVLPDGIGIKIGCRMQNVALKENVNGTDMFPILCKQLAATDLKMFLLGAKPGVAQKTAENMTKRFPGLKICGTHDGYFTEQEESKVIDYINQCKPDIVLVAMGAPRQELWIAENLEKMDTKIAMGVGGLFDFYSGMTQRAPRWVREIGMEWSWRILQEPQRMWKRYVIGNPLFLYRVWKYGDKQQAQQQSAEEAIDFELPEDKPFIIKYLRKALWLCSFKVQTLGKRLFDIVASGILLTVLSPLMLATALAIRIESNGSVLFHQTRIGKNGKPFKFWKFRSMYIDAEERKKALMENNEMQGGVLFKMRKDPRITTVGRIIRKTSIDELPQLWNVLTGDMSLVGPRPCLPGEAENYSANDRYRLDGAPGITCIWQISGRSDIPFKQQVEMDLEYLNKSSIKNDLSILIKTVPAVITGRGAY